MIAMVINLHYIVKATIYVTDLYCHDKLSCEINMILIDLKTIKLFICFLVAMVTKLPQWQDY